MVQEVRHLFFKGKEIVEALDRFRDANHNFLPEGTIKLVGVAKDGSVRVDVSMTYGVKVQSVSFDIRSEDILKCLIKECSHLRIPMPREGKKSLSGTSSGIMFKVRLDLADVSQGNSVALDTFEQALEVEPA
ncbi:MAG: hypothetical protein AAF742_09920 [Pseudomonadota bacterium]